MQKSLTNVLPFIQTYTTTQKINYKTLIKRLIKRRRRKTLVKKKKKRKKRETLRR